MVQLTPQILQNLGIQLSAQSPNQSYNNGEYYAHHQQQRAYAEERAQKRTRPQPRAYSEYEDDYEDEYSDEGYDNGYEDEEPRNRQTLMGMHVNVPHKSRICDLDSLIDYDVGFANHTNDFDSLNDIDFRGNCGDYFTIGNLIGNLEYRPPRESFRPPKQRKVKVEVRPQEMFGRLTSPPPQEFNGLITDVAVHLKNKMANSKPVVKVSNSVEDIQFGHYRRSTRRKANRDIRASQVRENSGKSWREMKKERKAMVEAFGNDRDEFRTDREEKKTTRKANRAQMHQTFTNDSKKVMRELTKPYKPPKGVKKMVKSSNRRVNIGIQSNYHDAYDSFIGDLGKSSTNKSKYSSIDDVLGFRW